MLSDRKMIILKSADDEEFAVEDVVAFESLLIKEMFGEGCTSSIVWLPNVTGPILSKVIAYCKRLVETRAEGKEDKLVELKSLDLEELFDVTSAANFMEISTLVDLTCENIANRIKGKTLEQIRKTLNITTDYTPEEEIEFRRVHKWSLQYSFLYARRK